MLFIINNTINKFFIMNIGQETGRPLGSGQSRVLQCPAGSKFHLPVREIEREGESERENIGEVWYNTVLGIRLNSTK